MKKLRLATEKRRKILMGERMAEAEERRAIKERRRQAKHDMTARAVYRDASGAYNVFTPPLRSIRGSTLGPMPQAPNAEIKKTKGRPRMPNAKLYPLTATQSSQMVVSSTAIYLIQVKDAP